ncbi:hypothetical protein [Paracoccus yeei]|uniref:hypothetical protein n=1 Tax=Paracoccus yeei TaxID=147645 RepID=UPI0028D2FB06|nr:hypothetical protein [Paracoccus yeei]
MRMLDHVPVRPNFIGGLPAVLHQVLLPWDIAGPESMVAFRLRCEAGRYPIQDFRWRQDVFLTRGGDAPVVRTLRQLAESRLAAFCLATATVANDQAMGNVAGGMLRGLTGPAEVNCHVTAGFVAFVNARPALAGLTPESARQVAVLLVPRPAQPANRVAALRRVQRQIELMHRFWFAQPSAVPPLRIAALEGAEPAPRAWG